MNAATTKRKLLLVLWLGLTAVAPLSVGCAKADDDAVHAEEGADAELGTDAHAEEHHGDEHAAGAHGASEHHGLDHFQLYAAALNFFVLLLLFHWKGTPAIAAFLKSRRKNVEDALNEAAEMKAAAEAKQKEYQERIAQLDVEIAKLREEMIKTGEAERDRIVAEAEQKAARMRRETEFTIEQQLKQLRIDLTREAVEAAVRGARTELEKQASDSDQQRLAKGYLEAVAKETSASGTPRDGKVGAA